MDKLDELHKEHSIAVIMFNTAKVRLRTVEEKLQEELQKQNGKKPTGEGVK